MIEREYNKLVSTILIKGEENETRSGNTISIFGYQFRHDLRYGFPLLTTKKINFTHIVNELLWFLSGSTNVFDLSEESRFMWLPWSTNDGNVGHGYGYQWIHGFGFSQIEELIENIKRNPNSRRHLVLAWNPEDNFNSNVILPPCHYSFQVNIQDDYLDLLFNMRSNDVAVGLPYNIASYALLTHLIANVVRKTPRYLIYQGGDVHIYESHVEKLKQQIELKPFDLPEIEVYNGDMENIQPEHIHLHDYQSHPYIKYDLKI